MIEATTDELLDFLANIIERAERFGATVLPPNDAPVVAWERDGDELIMDVAVHPPEARPSRLVEIVLQERWRSVERDQWQLAEYAYELRDHELGYRRALHRHHVDYFVRTYGVAAHEHCEASMGNPTCGHYMAEPCRGAIDGLDRLYALWLTGARPECSELRCLG